MYEAKRRKVDSSETRSKSGHYLIGYSSECISHSKLPTLREVLQYLLFIKESSVKSTKTHDSIRQTVDEVSTIWNMARIPLKQKGNMVRKLRHVYDAWLVLKKNIKRSNDVGGRRQAFRDKLDKLWDVGHSDAILSIIDNVQLSPSEKIDDIAFYVDQRHFRSGRIMGQDKIFERSPATVPTEISEEPVAASPSIYSGDEFVTLMSL